MIRVTVWNEFQHERTQEKVKEIYPDGISHLYCKVSETRGGAFGSDSCV